MNRISEDRRTDCARPVGREYQVTEVYRDSTPIDVVDAAFFPSSDSRDQSHPNRGIEPRNLIEIEPTIDDSIEFFQRDTIERACS